MSVLKLFRLKLLAYSAGRLAGSASEVKMNFSGIMEAQHQVILPARVKVCILVFLKDATVWRIIKDYYLRRDLLRSSSIRGAAHQ